MAFTRTESGLSNLHLFYDVEFIVFTEGGSKSFSHEEIESESYNTHSPDIKFWKSVLEEHGFNKKMQFRATGSKSTTNAICEKIIRKKIGNTIVVRDRDLGEISSKLYESPFIMYTKGYSWENDVFSADLTYKQIESMLFLGSIPDEILKITENSYNDFRKFGKHLLKLEIAFRKQGVKFISSVTGERFFNGKKSPLIDKSEVKKYLNEKKRNLERPVHIGFESRGKCPILNNYGKLIQTLSITIIYYVCRTYTSIKNIIKDMLVASMLERFAMKIRSKKDQYYKKAIETLNKELALIVGRAS